MINLAAAGEPTLRKQDQDLRTARQRSRRSRGKVTVSETW